MPIVFPSAPRSHSPAPPLPGLRGVASPTSRARPPELTTITEQVAEDALAYVTFPPNHRTKLSSTDATAHTEVEIKR